MKFENRSLYFIGAYAIPLLLLICLLPAYSTAAPARAKTIKTAVILPHSVHLRTSPSLKVKPSAWVLKGTVMEVTGEKRDAGGRQWYRVIKPGAGEYWVVARMVKITATAKRLDAGKVQGKSAGPVAVKPANTREETTPKPDEQKEEAKKPVSLEELYSKANSLFREGQYEKCVDTYDRAIDLAEAQAATAGESLYYFNMAACYMSEKKYREAVVSLDAAVASAEKTHSADIKALALINKSRALFAAGDAKAASDVLARATAWANSEIFFNSSLDDYVRAVVSLHLANVLFTFGDKDKAQEWVKYALKMNPGFILETDIIALLKAMKSPMFDVIERIDKDLAEAWASYGKSDFAAMEKSARSALDTSAMLGYNKGIFRSRYYLAISYLSRKDADNALKEALAAKKRAAAGKGDARLCLVSKLMGGIFMLNDEYDKALSSYEEYLTLSKQIGQANEADVLTVQLEMAGIYRRKGAYGSALTLLEDNLARAGEFGLRQIFLDELIAVAEKSKDKARLVKYRKMKAG